MRITILGCGDAFNSEGRGHACYLVDAEERRFVVDFGPTALMQARRFGVDPASIDVVLVTHAHGDHIGGLPFFLLDQVFIARRTRPLVVAGPPGLTDTLEALVRICYGDVIERHRRFDLEYVTLVPGTTATLEPLEVEAFEALHLPAPEVALCLRLRAPDGAVAAFSGDTALADGLRAAARGADLLIAECTTVEPTPAQHISWRDWRTELAEIGARRVVLSHLGPGVPDVIAAEARLVAPRLPVIAAHDGLVLDVGPG